MRVGPRESAGDLGLTGTLRVLGRKLDKLAHKLDDNGPPTGRATGKIGYIGPGTRS